MWCLRGVVPKFIPDKFLGAKLDMPPFSESVPDLWHTSRRRNLAEIAMDNESTEQKTNSFGNLDVLILTSKISRENMLR